MARRGRVRHIKAHRCYTFDEAAELSGVTIQTVRRWAKQGMRTMVAKRPYLVLGADLKDHLTERRQPKTLRLPVGKMKCLGCGAIKPPALGLVEYVPLSTKHGILRAICGGCEGATTRIVSRSDLPAWAAICEVEGNTAAHA